MRTGETLAISSCERFLEPEECRAILDAMSSHLAGLPVDRRRETARSRSVHSVPGLSLAETMRLYEPAGRLEIDGVPSAVEEFLARAAIRALPAVRRVYPSAVGMGSWIYLEYREGQ